MFDIDWEDWVIDVAVIGGIFIVGVIIGIIYQSNSMEVPMSQQFQFHVNDEVRFYKGNGPIMHVMEVNPNNCQCVWFDRNETFNSAMFSKEHLVLVQPATHATTIDPQQVGPKFGGHVRKIKGEPESVSATPEVVDDTLFNPETQKNSSSIKGKK